MAATTHPPSSSSVEHQRHSAVFCKPRPLMLKDFLREDQNSDSFTRRPAPSSANTVRQLLTLELNSSGGGVQKRSGIGAKVQNAAGCSRPFARLSAVINVLKMLPFSSTALTHPSPNQQGVLPRSLSKRLRRSFWRKCTDRDRPCGELASRRMLLVRDIIRRADDKVVVNTPPPPTPTKTVRVQPPTATSTAASSPTRPSCSTSGSASSWSELDSVGSSSSPVLDFANTVVKPAAARLNTEEEEEEEEEESTLKRAATLEHHPARRTVGGGRDADMAPPTQAGHRYPTVTEVPGAADVGVGVRFTCAEYEEKDQLSPVAVVDFPSSEDETEENDDGTSQTSGTLSMAGAEEEPTDPATTHQSAAFQLRLATIQRVKQRLLWKLQKFETLADLLDPDDLSDDAFGETDEAEAADFGVLNDAANGDECDGYSDEDEEEDHEETTTTWTEEVQVRARQLLDRLKPPHPATAAGNAWGILLDHEALLLDLFIQGLWDHDDRTRSRIWKSRQRTNDDDDDASRRRMEDDLLSFASAWLLQQAGASLPPRGDVKYSKAALIEELDKDGPWGRFLDPEEAEVVSVLADGVLDSLLSHLILHFLSS